MKKRESTHDSAAYREDGTGGVTSLRSSAIHRCQLRLRSEGLILALLSTVLLLSCRSTSEPDPNTGLTVQLDAVPLLLKAADTLEVSTIWATVLQDGQPVPDSTVVSLAASNGRIDAEARTRDGLARANFYPGVQVGVGSVIAQVKAVRDTVLITLY